MFAVAIGLQAVMDELAGDVVLFAVPAEEMIELITAINCVSKENSSIWAVNNSSSMKVLSTISIWLCKCMWRLPKLQLVKWGFGTSNGFVSKLIEYHGKVAHAAQAPHERHQCS